MTVIVGRSGTLGARKPNKFRNCKVMVGGEFYHSKKEAERHRQLQFLEKAQRIRNLRRQVKYVFDVAGVRIATYKADFVYEEYAHDAWSEVVEDVKGYPNDRWPMKKKLMKALYSIDVRET